MALFFVSPAKISRDEQLTMDREKKLRAAFKELGNGKNKIAASLKVKKIKGEKGDNEDCPLVNFVKKVLPKAESYDVSGEHISVGFKQGDVLIRLSKAQEDFIGAFDNGDYPELDHHPNGPGSLEDDD